MRHNLIEARKSINMTQVQLANSIGITSRYYQKLESGTINGSLDVWFKLREMLCRTLDDLVAQ